MVHSNKNQSFVQSACNDFNIANMRISYIIGYRSIRGYVRENLYDYLRAHLGNSLDKKGTEWFYSYNGAKIKFIFNPIRRTTSIEFSIPDLLYNDGFRIADFRDAERAVELVSNIIGRDFSLFTLSRLDITSNFKKLGNLYLYNKLVSAPDNYLGVSILQNSIIFHNKPKEKDSGQLLIFYSSREVLRVEARFKSKGYPTVKALIKKYIKHGSQVSEMLKESFYDNCVHYFYDSVLSAFNYYEINELIEGQETLKNLQDNYDYTYSPKHTLKLF